MQRKSLYLRHKLQNRFSLKEKRHQQPNSKLKRKLLLLERNSLMLQKQRKLQLRHNLRLPKPNQLRLPPKLNQFQRKLKAKKQNSLKLKLLKLKKHLLKLSSPKERRHQLLNLKQQRKYLLSEKHSRLPHQLRKLPSWLRLLKLKLHLKKQIKKL